MSNLSDAVNKAFEEFGEVEVPEGLPDEVTHIYRLAADRKCMCCEGKIKEQAIVVIAEYGMAQVYCSPRCLTDLMVLGWIMQEYDDLVQAVKFRGTAEH